MTNAVPTDSVLRRHYEATHGNKSANKAPVEPSSGFLAWLKSLFS